MPYTKRPILLTYLIWLIGLAILAVVGDRIAGLPAETVQSDAVDQVGLLLLRSVRLMALGIALFFLVPALALLEPLRQRREWLDSGVHRALNRGLAAVLTIIVLSYAAEIGLYGMVVAAFLGICTWPFWLLVVLGLIVVLILASGETIAISIESTQTTSPVFKMATGGLVDIDIQALATTDEPSHRPVTVNIDKVEVKTAPGHHGNVNIDITSVLNIVNQGTTAADATGTSVGQGFPQPVNANVSELHVTITATCSKGHTTTGTNKTVLKP